MASRVIVALLACLVVPLAREGARTNRDSLSVCFIFLVFAREHE
jgi:hypothetical protein